MYQEIKPSVELNNLIDSFWVFSNNEVLESFKVLPDTCTDLILDLNRDQGFVSGVMTKFQFGELAMNSNLIGVRIKSEIFGSLSKIPLSETKNLRVELSDIFPSCSLGALTQLNGLVTTGDKINFLESFIAKRFKENFRRQDKMVFSVAEIIRARKGNVSIGDLAKSNHISLRQLERRFKSYIGLTIKEFSNIVRFNSAKKAIANLKETSLLEIAYEMGFFDHSHMNYEFNRISDENPSFFR